MQFIMVLKSIGVSQVEAAPLSKFQFWTILHFLRKFWTIFDKFLPKIFTKLSKFQFCVILKKWYITLDNFSKLKITHFFEKFCITLDNSTIIVILHFLVK